MNPIPPRPDAPSARPPPGPVIIGVLGGIASGKSLAASLLAGPAGLVIDADRLAHAELESPAGRAFVAARFGAGVLGPGGAPDRERLADLVFRDPRARKDLEDWIHPRVRATIVADLEHAARCGRRAVLDVPLLLENDASHGLAGRCTALVFVEAGDAVRARRALERRGWQPEELARREAAQMPLAAKRARADILLDNNGSPAELERQITAALDRILARAPFRPPS